MLKVFLCNLTKVLVVFILFPLCSSICFAGQTGYNILNGIEGSDVLTQDAHLVLFGWGSKEVTPEGTVERFMEAKGVLERGGSEDLSVYFTPEYVSQLGDSFYEFTIRLRLPYGSMKRVFNIKLSSTAVNGAPMGYQLYLVSDPQSYYKAKINVLCKTDSNQKIENCQIAKVE